MSKRSRLSMQDRPAENKVRGNFFCKRFQVPALCLLGAAIGACAWAEVRLETAKPQYKRTEAVSFTLTNGLQEVIASAAAASKPEDALVNFEKRKNTWVWDALAVRCPRIECPGQAGEPQLENLKPGQQCSFSWKPRFYAAKSLQVPGPGTYRVTVLYQKRSAADPRQLVWATVKSNEFTLLE